MRCCARDEGRPFGTALRRGVPNHRVLRWLKTVVVSDTGKGALDCVRWVCHERWSLGSVGGSRGWRCCAVDEGWPFGVALRGEASNRLMLRRLNAGRGER
jgi:hypothetical protein